MMITDTPPQGKKVEVVGQEVEKMGQYGMFQFMGVRQWQSIADNQCRHFFFKSQIIKSPRVSRSELSARVPHRKGEHLTLKTFRGKLGVSLEPSSIFVRIVKQISGTMCLVRLSCYTTLYLPCGYGCGLQKKNPGVTRAIP